MGLTLDFMLFLMEKKKRTPLPPLLLQIKPKKWPLRQQYYGHGGDGGGGGGVLILLLKLWSSTYLKIQTPHN